MALSPTIYKFDIALSDLDRHHYDQLNLTVAHHPSETMPRTMARLLAFCINAEQDLQFCKGLSDAEEPDIWAHELDGDVRMWIEVGEPAPKRIKKAARIAKAVRVYTFNSKSEAWWAREGNAMRQLKASVYRFDTQAIEALAALVERTMRLSITISGQSAFINLDDAELEVTWSTLHEPTVA